MVSNPWREAIEVSCRGGDDKNGIVSNPWREAIEENISGKYLERQIVSNPWREAIEGEPEFNEKMWLKGFQSLEGGY